MTFYRMDEPTKVVRTVGNGSEPDGTLDPDVALWKEILLNIWPFAGAPTAGEWPKGWLGVDNTSTLYVCTVGGRPGTWVPIAGALGTVEEITSTGGTIAVTHPTGPIVNVETVSAAPTGAAGGDLSGTYPNPTVAKINGAALGTTIGATTGFVLTWNGTGYVPLAVPPPTFQLSHSYAVLGPITAQTLPPFFVPVMAGQTATLEGVRCVLQSGTSVALNLQLNGTGITGLTAVSVTGTATTTNASSPPALSNGDAIQGVLSSPSGSPIGLTISVIVQYT